MINIRSYLKKGLNFIWMHSLKKAAKEQNLDKLSFRLANIVPDIREQYSLFDLDSPYLLTKVRNVHAFQMSLVEKIIEEFETPVIVDIGDSSGTHLQYILGLYSQDKKIRCLSINLDKKAVDKIKSKGLEAINARAEELSSYNIDADIFLCFETLEHLMNPCHFLHQLSSMTKAKYLIITVPYLKNSRIGLHHIRRRSQENVYAENTHIFELNPEDWKLLVRHSGWEVMEKKVYLQYPRKGLLRITKPLWKKYDFEGFYGLILRRDACWSSRYLDW